jgi:hypothetical protein
VSHVWTSAVCAAMMAWAGAALAEDASKISVSQDPRPPQVTVAPLPVGSKARSLSLARVSDTMRQGQPWADICGAENVCSTTRRPGIPASKDSPSRPRRSGTFTMNS